MTFMISDMEDTAQDIDSFPFAGGGQAKDQPCIKDEQFQAIAGVCYGEHGLLARSDSHHRYGGIVHGKVGLGGGHSVVVVGAADEVQ